MDNLHCNRCGEEYSSTYHRCPFCQEIAAERRGRPIYRSGKRLSKKQRSAGAGGVIKLVLAAVCICAVLLVFFGDDMAEFMGIRTGRTDPPPVEDNQHTDPPVDPQPDDTLPPDNGGDDTGSEEGGSGSEETPDDGSGDSSGDDSGEAPVTEPLTLSQSAITIPAGETARITAAGGSGEIVWSSSNENIAIVNGGSVTGIAGGTVTITAACGSETVTCTVTVTGDPWVSPEELKLNYTDFTLRVGDPPVKMKVIGTDSPVIWTSSDVTVATIDENGVVRRVGKGNCTITAEVDGQKLTCIVRVS